MIEHFLGHYIWQGSFGFPIPISVLLKKRVYEKIIGFHLTELSFRSDDSCRGYISIT